MSKIVFIDTEHTCSDNTSGEVEIPAELINNDIDTLADIEANTKPDDDYDENNIFGY